MSAFSFASSQPASAASAPSRSRCGAHAFVRDLELASEHELQAARACNTNEYVSKSRMMTVRVAPELLDAVKARAKRLGRSTSAEVVLILERELEIPSSPASAVMGMFSGFEEMAASELRRERRRLSRRLLAAARETASK